MEVKTEPLSGAYDMKPGCHGLTVIINIKAHSPRRGASVDEENLKTLFRFLGYKVHIYRDVDLKGVKSILTKVQKFDHSPYDSFVCCILWHGDKDAVHSSDSEMEVNINDLMEQLNGDQCPTLVNKPKLFFIQACCDDKPKKRLASDSGFIPNTSDFFFSFAVQQGYPSKALWRLNDHEKGSLYVTELCRALGEHATHAPLIEIMLLVNQHVTEKSASTSQAPEFVHRLRKHVFFF